MIPSEISHSHNFAQSFGGNIEGIVWRRTLNDLKVKELKTERFEGEGGED